MLVDGGFDVFEGGSVKEVDDLLQDHQLLPHNSHHRIVVVVVVGIVVIVVVVAFGSRVDEEIVVKYVINASGAILQRQRSVASLEVALQAHTI